MTISDEIEIAIRAFADNVNDFINCKSEVKYAMAGASKTCLLTSPIENYIKVITNGVNRFIIDDDAEMWIEQVKYLYKNRDIKDKVIMNPFTPLVITFI